MQKDLQISNIMEVPKIEKITLSMGIGEALSDKKVAQNVMQIMSTIAGQKAVLCPAKKSVASFKVRKGWIIGCKVTLRKKVMYNFLDRLVNIAIPRIRDFRGFNKNKGMDGFGNFNMGITEQIIFPEVDYEKLDKIRGMNISITTSASNNEHALKLLKAFNFPFTD